MELSASRSWSSVTFLFSWSDSPTKSFHSESFKKTILRPAYAPATHLSKVSKPPQIIQSNINISRNSTKGNITINQNFPSNVDDIEDIEDIDNMDISSQNSQKQEKKQQKEPKQKRKRTAPIHLQFEKDQKKKNLKKDSNDENMTEK